MSQFINNIAMWSCGQTIVMGGGPKVNNSLGTRPRGVANDGVFYPASVFFLS